MRRGYKYSTIGKRKCGYNFRRKNYSTPLATDSDARGYNVLQALGKHTRLQCSAGIGQTYAATMFCRHCVYSRLQLLFDRSQNRSRVCYDKGFGTVAANKETRDSDL
jgi:hypothetical protein